MKHFDFSAVLGLVLLTACGQGTPQVGKVKGHAEYINEKYTAQTSKDNLLVRPIAVPEYRPSKSVIISLTVLTSSQQHAMAKALLDSDLETLYVMVPRSYGYKTAAQSPDFKALKSLGADLSKIVLVPAKDSSEKVSDGVSGKTYLTVWARDWSPQTAYTSAGQLVLLDFNYYSNRDADDSAARSLVDLFNQDLPVSAIVTSPEVVSRVSVPVYNEGGNFMNNDDGDCLMTSRVTDANSPQAIAQAAADNSRKNITNDEVMDKQEIIRQYTEKAGCKRVTIFPRIPYEGTGHIDMWAKFLDNKTVIVNELRDEVVNIDWYTDEERSKAKEVQTYLDARARDIANLGLTVIRIPMPAIVFGYAAYNNASKTEILEVPDIWRSYTNSITVNGTAVTPRYKAMDADGYVYDAATSKVLGTVPLTNAYPDAGLIKSYEDEARRAYESAGYKMNFVTVDNLISIGGAIHCTTMQIAKNPDIL
ncbi:MAG TPA: agmatine deiminase family protein [Oligoflexus sp.]|uniref:agmatine deiminase family protein n=1 Tax=Oligoflexus sp. TaxID=1971216 RepID=UPI002D48037A|nr:agmatine deiminase family protein [Oligoflexus sp.]HYX37818.1 agmatine deiminase family protein [Oligoflexus sp.]